MEQCAGPSVQPAHQALSHIDTISCMVLDPVEQQQFRGLVPERAGSDTGYQISSRRGGGGGGGGAFTGLAPELSLDQDERFNTGPWESACGMPEIGCFRKRRI